MTVLSMQAFVPSGPEFERSASLFRDLGFNERWNAGDYIGFEKDGFGFILQRYKDRAFAENFMMNVGVPDADQLWAELKEKGIEASYGVRLGAPTDMPYGREVNLIDIAGVCWHFVQQ